MILGLCWTQRWIYCQHSKKLMQNNKKNVLVTARQFLTHVWKTVKLNNRSCRTTKRANWHQRQEGLLKI